MLIFFTKYAVLYKMRSSNREINKMAPSPTKFSKTFMMSLNSCPLHF